MLKLENVVKEYVVTEGKEKKYTRAIDGVSLSFPAIQFVSILGPSGCGKTTLLNLIGGLDSVTEGNITVDGMSLKGMETYQMDAYRNEYIGFIFQDYILIPQLTILDNVKLGLQIKGKDAKEIDKLALEALEKVGLGDVAKKKPNQLSGGQAQRVAIARAIVTEPKIILADEPTGALDSKTSTQILDLLKEISKDYLVIMVTHNEEIAEEYSDRIIRLKDGKVVSDTYSEETAQMSEEPKDLKKKKSLPFLTSLKLAFNNVRTKKWKTVLTGIANSFGMLGIAFVLAINTGFDVYLNQLSSATASSLPVVVTSYSTTTESETYADVNQSETYPDADEIYPSVSTSSETSYTYNNITSKYINYVDSLIDEGIVDYYVTNYSVADSLNLTTEFPASIDGESESYVAAVNTSINNYNSYAASAGLPYNIFHVLYGDMDDYDLLCGSLPENKNQLVLVVDKYNAVSFNILKNLGFYNSADTENDVKDATLETKVTPISFNDIIGKKYKVFDNDTYYSKANISPTYHDALGNDRTPSFYEVNDSEALYEDASEGIELEISGIIRPKEDSAYVMLSPALCYTNELDAEIADTNSTSEIASTFKDNVVMLCDEGDETSTLTAFANELNEAVSPYLNGEDSTFPTSTVKSILNSYFYYYRYSTTYSSTNEAYSITRYSGLSTMVSDAMSKGVQLIADEYQNIDFSDSEEINELIDSFSILDLMDEEKCYDLVISLAAYLNGFSLIESVVIFPTSLANRETLLEKLDEFNEIQANSSRHASDASEQVFYASQNNSYMISNVASMVELVTTVLLIYAAISLVVSCSMTAIVTLNSVMERKKEIGLLRSLGAKKRDVTAIFEIESLFMGLVTGIIGCIFTVCLSIPVNALIYSYYPNYGASQICYFTWYHALIVIALSLVISFIAALIPSLKAGNQDPVKCIKSE